MSGVDAPQVPVGTGPSSRWCLRHIRLRAAPLLTAAAHRRARLGRRATVSRYRSGSRMKKGHGATTGNAPSFWWPPPHWLITEGQLPKALHWSHLEGHQSIVGIQFGAQWHCLGGYQTCPLMCARSRECPVPGALAPVLVPPGVRVLSLQDVVWGPSRGPRLPCRGRRPGCPHLVLQQPVSRNPQAAYPSRSHAAVRRCSPRARRPVPPGHQPD